MKKLFNNSTKGTKNDLSESKSKRKFLKTFSFTSLALLMGAAGVFAFAPLGASPSVANASEMVETTTEQGLITPKADDPVIYTTESGLDIKWGNTPSVNNSLAAGNLAGFPYFTTSSGSTTYTWVIIGRNSNTGVFESAARSHLFSNWKTDTYHTATYTNKNTFSKYFFDTTHEISTPAGSAINTATASKSYVMDYFYNNLPKTNNDEIPSGCVLVLSNDIIGSGNFSTDDTFHATWYLAYYTNNSEIRTIINGYYSNDTLGLNQIKSQIQETTIKTCAYYNVNVGTSNASYEREAFSEKTYLFPLSAGNSVDTDNPNNFIWSNYLTANQMKLSSNQWLRGTTSIDSSYSTNIISGRAIFRGMYLTTSGSLAWQYVAGYSYGYRPAFVLKL